MKKQRLKIRKSYLIFTALCVISLLIGAVLSFFLRPGSIPFLQPTKNISSEQDIAYGILDKCAKVGEQCYSVEFGKLTKEENLATSLEILGEVNKLDPGTRGCHLIAHSITYEETAKDVDNWKEILKQVPPDRCTGGFLHGIFEARQAKDPSFTLNETTIPELCEVVRENAPGGKDQDCAHISGHILVVINEGDLQKANTICAKLPEEFQYECHSGVYMENETRDGIVDHGLGKHIPWNKQTTATQQKLCENAVGGTEANACWREISHMYVFIANHYPPDAYKLCQRAGDPKWTNDCYLHGVGIMTVTAGFEPKNFDVLCAPYEKNDQEYATCMSWGIGSMLTSSPEFVDMAIQFCKAVPYRFAENCFGRVSRQVASIVPADKLATYCKDMPYPYKNRCEHPYL